jgi:uncharacterized protein YqhQ
MSEKVRLGGMALANGVLVHGPSAWACAVRLPDGSLRVESARKGFRAAQVHQPLLRGPARLAEVFLLIPEVKRALPEARLPFERPRVLTTMVASAAVAGLVRRSRTLSPAARELVAAVASLAPAALALRDGELAAYHGAEHISIGTYEQGEAAAKEHERCGSHLIGPLVATLTVANVLAARAPAHLRNTARAAASFGAVAVSTEIFNWMVRHPDNPVSRALARPGHELQHRLATAEPTAEQLEVAEAALVACLSLEDDGRDSA